MLSTSSLFAMHENSSGVDALSHSLVAWILFAEAGLVPLLPYAVLGTVLPDADIFFSFISDNDPSLYLFTHGGIAHSLAGALILSFLSCGVIYSLSMAGITAFPLVAGGGVSGFLAVLTGALLHLAIDVLACPGIPLLAPFSDRKFTIGILPGPSILLAFAALGVVLVTVTQLLEFSQALQFYTLVVVIYLTVRGGFFVCASIWIKGRKVPKVNPLHWLVISEDEEYCTIREYSMVSGVIRESVTPRYKLTSAEEVKAALRLPEVMRLFYYSYSIIAERTGPELILSDPLRENGYLYYPPHFKRVTIPMEGQP
jgi:inner membrane protein